MMERLCKQFVLFWFPLLLFCLLIFIMSSHPAPRQIPKIPHIDKVLHYTAYAVLGVLFYRALNTLSLNVRLLIVFSIALSSAYGLSDEIHQYFIPYRNSDILDLLADIFGSISGVSVFHIWMTRKNRMASGT